MVSCNNLYISGSVVVFMRLEKIEFDENDSGRRKAILDNAGEEVLLEDSENGALVGEIHASYDSPAHYLLHFNRGSVKDSFLLTLEYNNLLDLYAIN